MPRKGYREPFADRLARLCDMSGGPDACWPWIGAVIRPNIKYGRKRRKLKQPRGVIKFNGKRCMAYRVAKFVADGLAEMPPSCIQAAHQCDNPICVNPSHIEWQSGEENRADYVARHYGQIKQTQGEFTIVDAAA